MGLGHVPQEPLRAQGQGPVVQGRQRRGAAAPGPQPVDRSRLARGQVGEDTASRWYVAAGYTVLDRNWRCAEGELDLVVGRGGVVVFCEVKARATTRHGYASGAVDARKQRKLRALAARWLAVHPHVRRSAIRFDVAAIVGTHVDVIESAF